MKNVKVLFAASLVAGAAAAMAVGCGSSKNNNSSGNNDSGSPGGEDGGDSGPSGLAGAACSPISLGAGTSVMTCAPDMGLTCCVDLANIASVLSGGSLGTCEATTSCTSTIQYQCLGPSSCGTASPVCCGSATGDAGALESALGDASFPDGSISLDASFDAAGFSLDAAASLLSGLSFEANCVATKSACSGASNYILCGANSDCPTGEICAAPPAALFGGAGGGSIDGFSLSSVISIEVCQSPDAGTGTTTSDAGTTTTDAGTTTTDAGTTESDAATPITDGATSGG
jgi:hypothetical protein